MGGFLRYRAVPVWVLVLLRSAGGQALAPSLREHVDPRVHVSIVDLRSPSLYTTRAHPNAWASAAHWPEVGWIRKLYRSRTARRTPLGLCLHFERLQVDTACSA